MKKLLTLSLCLSVVAAAATAQEKSNVKKGWNFGPLPAVSYNSDLGFQYGALCDIFYYGDGSTFPQYVHKFNVELSRYTKGQTVAHLFYDSKHLISGGIRLTAAATYLDSKMAPFYGFNGFLSPYDYDYTDKGNALYNPAFYAIDRKMLRILADFQGKLRDNLGWVAGLTFWDVATDRVQLEAYKEKTTLYDLYAANLLISPDEHSGQHLEFKAGLVLDTRDFEPAPSKGYCAELLATGSPDWFGGNGYNYVRLLAQWRQFFTPIPGRLTLAYRLSYQDTFGKTPFYLQQTISTLYLRQVQSEGLGGKNTVRGILQNRILADGYVWANFEARVRVVDFRFINQAWYLALNPFFDTGIVTRSRYADRQEQIGLQEVYSGDADGLHSSAGIGIKLVMNQNFIVSCEWGKPFDKRDGKSGMNIGLNYIF